MVTPDSSTKTYWRASRSGSVSRHRRRAAATSGRRCSSACTVFFNGQPQPIDFQPQRAERRRRRQRLAQFRQGRIRPRGDQRRQALLLARQAPATETSFACAARSSPSLAAAAPTDAPTPDSPRISPRPRPRRRSHPTPSATRFRKSIEYGAPSAPPRERSTMTAVLCTSRKRSNMLRATYRYMTARGELVEPRAKPLVLRQAQDERMY